MDTQAYDNKNYFAVIGDIIDSKMIQDRIMVQQNLSTVLSKINETYTKCISSKFMITLGDEFQGLLSNGENIVDIINAIEREMYPVKLRFGIGVGSITTKIDYELPIGADGPAYYNARKMIEHNKMIKKTKKEIRANIGIKIEGDSNLSNLINSIFSLNTVLKQKWSSRQREVINAFIKSNEVQGSTASMLGIHQSSVQRALKTSGFYEYQQANQSITNALSSMAESYND